MSFTKNGSEILFSFIGADCIHLYDLIGEHLMGTDCLAKLYTMRKRDEERYEETRDRGKKTEIV